MPFPLNIQDAVRFFAPKRLTFQVETSEKEIYLTFDDGPVPEVTPALLDLLDKYDTKATFFCVGRNVEKHPSIYEDLLKRGHATGNHTYNHLNGWKTPVEEYLEDIARCARLVKSDLFRPPYGRITPKQIKAIPERYRIIMWSVLSRDYNQNLSMERLLVHTAASTRKGTIVVFHDSVKASGHMMAMLPAYLKAMTGHGYTFKTLS